MSDMMKYHKTPMFMMRELKDRNLENLTCVTQAFKKFIHENATPYEFNSKRVYVLDKKHG